MALSVYYMFEKSCPDSSKDLVVSDIARMLSTFLDSHAIIDITEIDITYEGSREVLEGQDYCDDKEAYHILAAQLIVVVYGKEISENLEKRLKYCRILGKPILFLSEQDYGLPFT